MTLFAFIVASLFFYGDALRTRPPQSAQKIQNWVTTVDFNATISEVHDPPGPHHISHIHRFLEGFTTFTLRYKNPNDFRKEIGMKTLEESDTTRAGSIDQDFDHFSSDGPNAGQKWRQHFYYTADATGQLTGAYSEINFLMLEGEGGFSKSWISDSWAFVQWAKQWNATAFILEHRFYGDSALNGNTSLERLELLTADQALADAAVFIENINRERKFKNPKWIAFGGSYPGNLAAWLRLKYPNLVLGAIASSAPVQAKVDFYEYVQVVEDSFKRYGPAGCADSINKFFALAEDFFWTPQGRRLLRVCEPSAGKTLSQLDSELFFSNHIGSLSTAVQYDDIAHNQLNTTCNHYTKWVSFLDKNKNNPNVEVSGCTDYDFLADTKAFASSPSLTYYWYWQTCNEFGYFQTSTRKTSTYSVTQDAISVNFYASMCEKIFGSNYNLAAVHMAANYTNEDFGGVKGFNTTNVVFLNGSEDPWHVLSILEDRESKRLHDNEVMVSSDPDIRSVLIEGTSHCYDMYAQYTGEENPGLIKAHAVAKAELAKWLS